MKTPFLENQRDASMRLAGTVVRFRGEPFYIRDVDGGDGGLTVRGKFLISGKLVDALKLGVEDWNFIPVPLGYVNLPRGDARFESRMPTRKWKQGLAKNHLRHTQIDSRSLGKTILGQYPTLGRAKERTLEREVTTAFARNWALGGGANNIHVLYRDKRVGRMEEDGIHLSPEYRFLQEDLQENIR